MAICVKRSRWGDARSAAGPSIFAIFVRNTPDVQVRAVYSRYTALVQAIRRHKNIAGKSKPNIRVYERHRQQTDRHTELVWR